MLKQNKEYKRFVWELSNMMENKSKNKNVVFMCIGTNTVVGDSVGPIVGSLLKENIQSNNKIKIVGDCENNISYENIEDKIKKLKLNSLVVVVDSALSNPENIGKIFVQNRGLRYGEGLKKPNTTIGNISIKAVVGEDFDNKLKNFKSLKKATASDVMLLANTISTGIIHVLNSCV